MLLQPPYCCLFRNPCGSSFKTFWEGSRSDDEFAATEVVDETDGNGRGSRDNEDFVSTKGFGGNRLLDSCCQSKERQYFSNHNKDWPKIPFLNLG